MNSSEQGSGKERLLLRAALVPGVLCGLRAGGEGSGPYSDPSNQLS